MRFSGSSLMSLASLTGLCLAAAVGPALADNSLPATDLNMGMIPDPQKGYEIITKTAMSAPIMKVADVERIWQVWEPEEKSKAESATPEKRREMTFARYGWAKRLEGDMDPNIPLDYTPDSQGNLVTNCFACHGGRVAGKTTPGGGNSHIDLTALATDVMKLKSFDAGRDPSTIKDMKGPFNTPLNFHKGTTNAVIFAPMVVGMVDPTVGAELMRNPSQLQHHDMNAPAWWLYKKKTRIYADGFAPKTPRQLMPFAISPRNTEEQFHALEPNFVHIQAYIATLDPPKYPYDVDNKLASRGRELFEMSCARCHGTYGPNAKYPNKVVPLKEIGTDPVRLHAISRAQREKANTGWIQYFGEHLLELESTGYVAQPLDGIWATGPYLHNGAIPTLYHLFNPAERPRIWKRDEDGYDQKRIGIAIEEFASVPEGLNTRQRRAYYDTSHVGNSAQGHLFPDELEADEKVAVIEYLKTL